MGDVGKNETLTPEDALLRTEALSLATEQEFGRAFSRVGGKRAVLLRELERRGAAGINLKDLNAFYEKRGEEARHSRAIRVTLNNAIESTGVVLKTYPIISDERRSSRYKFRLETQRVEIVPEIAKIAADIHEKVAEVLKGAEDSPENTMLRLLLNQYWGLPIKDVVQKIGVSTEGPSEESSEDSQKDAEQFVRELVAKANEVVLKPLKVAIIERNGLLLLVGINAANSDFGKIRIPYPSLASETKTPKYSEWAPRAPKLEEDKPKVEGEEDGEEDKPKVDGEEDGEEDKPKVDGEEDGEEDKPKVDGEEDGEEGVGEYHLPVPPPRVDGRKTSGDTYRHLLVVQDRPDVIPDEISAIPDLVKALAPAVLECFGPEGKSDVRLAALVAFEAALGRIDRRAAGFAKERIAQMRDVVIKARVRTMPGRVLDLMTVLQLQKLAKGQ